MPFYTLSGPADAPVVLLLHGLGSSGDDWEHQVAALADYRVLGVDLPGHHRSARPAARPSIEAMAASVSELLGALRIRRAHVVGLSLGGCVGLALALQAPERVASLVLVNAFARLRPSGLGGVARGAMRLTLAVLAPMAWLGTMVAREAFPAPQHAALRARAAARIAANSRGAYLGSLRALLRFDVRASLGAIACPTLVVAGAQDRTVPLAEKAALARAIPGARLEIVADSGHVTAYDQPEALTRLIREHLARVDPWPPTSSRA